MDVLVPILIEQAVDDPFRLLIFLVVDVLPDGPGSGGDINQRLLPGGDAVRDDVIQLPPVLPLMDLIHQPAMDVQAVQRVAVGCQRLERPIVVELAGELRHQGLDPL